MKNQSRAATMETGSKVKKTKNNNNSEDVSSLRRNSHNLSFFYRFLVKIFSF